MIDGEIAVGSPDDQSRAAYRAAESEETIRLRQGILNADSNASDLIGQVHQHWGKMHLLHNQGKTTQVQKMLPKLGKLMDALAEQQCRSHCLSSQFVQAKWNLLLTDEVPEPLSVNNSLSDQSHLERR